MAVKRKNFCVIGVGNHAITKIIPAILNTDNNLRALVSSKSKTKLKKIINTSIISVKIFNKVNEALDRLPNDTIYVLCGPSLVNFEHLPQIIKKNCSVFIEKPAFIQSSDLDKIVNLINYKKIFLTENLMYKHTDFYKLFLNYWKINKKKINQINLFFHIPDSNTQTFRNQINNYPINLYDIGCYPISLLNDLEIKDLNLSIKKIYNIKNIKKEKIHIEGNIKNLNINIQIGRYKNYKNKVEIILLDKSKIAFSPFFYGRKSIKYLYMRKLNRTTIDRIFDDNAFEVMFNLSHKHWRNNQKKNIENMYKNLKILEKLSLQYLGKLKKNDNI